MKKILLLVLALFIIANTFALSYVPTFSLTISGAGTTNVNRTISSDFGPFNGHPMPYFNGWPIVFVAFNYGGTGSWEIWSNTGGDAMKLRYTNPNATANPPATGWVVGVDGTAPVPTLCGQSVQGSPVCVATQTITFNALSDRSYGAADFAPGASANSGLTVSYTSSNTAVATIVSNQVHIVGVGSTTIYADQAGNAGYSAAPQKSQTLNIIKASLTVTGSNASKNYGSDNPSFTVAYSGFVNSETAENLTSAPTASCEATQYSNAGSYNVVPLGGTSGNYSFNYVNGTLTVSKSSLAIGANNASKNYGDLNPSFTLWYEGFKGTDDASVLDVVAEISNTAGQFSNAGEYNIVPSSASDNNYDITFYNGILTIAKAPLLLGASYVSKTYGDVNPSFTAWYEGFKGTDDASVLDVAVEFSTAAGQYSDAGEYDILTSGASDINYEISFNKGTLAIGKAPLLLGASYVSKTYGDENPSLTAWYEGFKGTDDASVLDVAAEFSTAAGQFSDAGEYDILTSGASDNNYEISFNKGTLAIGKAPLLIGASYVSKTYGDENPSLTTWYEGFKGTDDASVLDIAAEVSTAAGQFSDAGEYDILASGASDINYEISFNKGTLAIDKAPLLLGASYVSKTYGDVNPSFTAWYEGFKGTDDASVLDVAPEISTTAGQFSDAGEYSIVPSGASDNNYAVSYENGVLTVEKANLDITALDASRLNGAANPAFELSFEGFLGSDSKTNIDVLPAISCPANAASSNGDYAIELTDGSDNNYNLILHNGTLTVNFATTVNSSTEIRVLAYPNPATDVLYLENVKENAVIGLYNMLGSRISSRTCVSTVESIDLSRLLPGSYIIRISGIEKPVTVKFIKK